MKDERSIWTRGFAAGVCAAWRVQPDDDRVRTAIKMSGMTLKMFEEPDADVPDYDLNLLREIFKRT